MVLPTLPASVQHQLVKRRYASERSLRHKKPLPARHVQGKKRQASVATPCGQRVDPQHSPCRRPRHEQQLCGQRPCAVDLRATVLPISEWLTVVPEISHRNWKSYRPALARLKSTQGDCRQYAIQRRRLSPPVHGFGYSSVLPHRRNASAYEPFAWSSSVPAVPKSNPLAETIDGKLSAVAGHLSLKIKEVCPRCTRSTFCQVSRPVSSKLKRHSLRKHLYVVALDTSRGAWLRLERPSDKMHKAHLSLLVCSGQPCEQTLQRVIAVAVRVGAIPFFAQLSGQRRYSANLVQLDLQRLFSQVWHTGCRHRPLVFCQCLANKSENASGATNAAFGP